MAKITLDLSRNDVLYVRGNTGNGCRYIQDGVEFTANGEVIGDEQAILDGRNKEVIAKATAKLEALKKDMAAAEAEVSQNSPVETAEAKAKEVADAREAMKAEVRAELAEEAALEAKAAEAPKTPDVKPVVLKAPPKTAPKAPKAS